MLPGGPPIFWQKLLHPYFDHEIDPADESNEDAVILRSMWHDPIDTSRNASTPTANKVAYNIAINGVTRLLDWGGTPTWAHWQTASGNLAESGATNRRLSAIPRTSALIFAGPGASSSAGTYIGVWSVTHKVYDVCEMVDKANKPFGDPDRQDAETFFRYRNINPIAFCDGHIGLHDKEWLWFEVVRARNCQKKIESNTWNPAVDMTSTAFDPRPDVASANPP
jgi:hypothetical protein